jgi:uncharacterized protein (TIGR03067 family)
MEAEVIGPLEGTWERLCILKEGGQLDAQRFGIDLVTIRDKTWTTSLKGMKGMVPDIKPRLRLDGTQRPKAFDLTYDDHRGGNYTYLGIYRVEGEYLVTCYGFTGCPRPRTFTAHKGSNNIMVFYRRVKPME